MDFKEEGRSLRQQCERAYQAADEEGKGYLTREDYKVAVISLFGYKPSKYEVNAVWSQHCSTGDGSEGLAKVIFVDLMLSRLCQQDSDDLIRQVFLSFDRQSRGFISLDDCKKAFSHVAPHVSEACVEGMFSEVDVDGDGRVSYRDFELMMNHFKLTRIQ